VIAWARPGITTIQTVIKTRAAVFFIDVSRFYNYFPVPEIT
jgi:hypothetical protein